MWPELSLELRRDGDDRRRRGGAAVRSPSLQHQAEPRPAAWSARSASDGQSARDGGADPERRRQRAPPRARGDDVAAGSRARPRHRVMAYPQKQTAAIAATAEQHGRRGAPARGRNAGGNRGHLDGFGARIAPSSSARSRVAGGLGSTTRSRSATATCSRLERQRRPGSVRHARSRPAAPVAVFSGNITTTYGRDGLDVQSPDMVHEQMPPTAHWSLKYVAAALPPQARTSATRCSVSRGASLWRILAANDDTDGPVHQRRIPAARSCQQRHDEGGRGDRVDRRRRFRGAGVALAGADDAGDRLRGEPVAGDLRRQDARRT